MGLSIHRVVVFGEAWMLLWKRVVVFVGLLWVVMLQVYSQGSRFTSMGLTQARPNLKKLIHIFTHSKLLYTDLFGVPDVTHIHTSLHQSLAFNTVDCVQRNFWKDFLLTTKQAKLRLQRVECLLY